MLDVLLDDYTAVEDLLHRASARSEACLFFSKKFFRFLLQFVEDDSQHDLAGVTDEADRPVVLARAEIAFPGERNDERLCPLLWPFLGLPQQLNPVHHIQPSSQHFSQPFNPSKLPLNTNDKTNV